MLAEGRRIALQMETALDTLRAELFVASMIAFAIVVKLGSPQSIAIMPCSLSLLRRRAIRYIWLLAKEVRSCLSRGDIEHCSLIYLIQSYHPLHQTRKME